jgi:hypothetical protein
MVKVGMSLVKIMSRISVAYFRVLLIYIYCFREVKVLKR